MVYSAFFAAIIFLTTAYIFHIPAPNSGYVHLGDAFIYISACILPMPYAAVAGAIGCGLADLVSGAVVWIIPTVIIKALMVLPFSNKGKIMTKRNFIATLISGFGSMILYLLVEMAIYGNPMAVLMTIPHGSIQPIGSTILFVIVAMAFDKIKIKERLF